MKVKESSAKEERDNLNSEQQQQTKEKTRWDISGSNEKLMFSFDLYGLKISYSLVLIIYILIGLWSKQKWLVFVIAYFFRLEFVIKDLKDEVTGDNKSKDRAEQELTKLRETISAKEKELDSLKPQYEEMKKKEEECTRELALKEQKRKELYAKQGRGSQFTSKEQRDEWIKKELKSLNKQLKDKTEQIDRLTEDLKKDAKRKVELEKRIEEAASEQENFRYILGSVYVSNKYTIFLLTQRIEFLVSSADNILCIVIDASFNYSWIFGL